MASTRGGGADATPPRYLSKPLGGGGGGGGGGLEGVWGGGVGWRVWGVPKVGGGGGCARPTTTTCIPPGGSCAWGGLGETAGGCCEAGCRWAGVSTVVVVIFTSQQTTFVWRLVLLMRRSKHGWFDEREACTKKHRRRWRHAPQPTISQTNECNVVCRGEGEAKHELERATSAFKQHRISMTAFHSHAVCKAFKCIFSLCLHFSTSSEDVHMLVLLLLTC